MIGFLALDPGNNRGNTYLDLTNQMIIRNLFCNKYRALSQSGRQQLGTGVSE